MTIREKIGKMPAWKAIVIIFLGIFFMLAGIEELFISRIFKLFDHRITQFEKIFKEDDKDLEEDTNQFHEQMEYDRAESKLEKFKIQRRHLDTHQNEYCDYLIINRELNNLLNLAYVKHHSNTKKFILEEITDNKQYINKLDMVGQFDPSICKDVAL